MHITEAIEVHHKRHGGDDNEHHCRNRVEKHTKFNYKIIGKLKPSEIKHLQLLANTIDNLPLSGSEEISKGNGICDNGGNAHRQSA